MKSLFQLTCIVLFTMLFACQNDAETQNSKGDAAQAEAELPADPADRMAARSRNPVNTSMAGQLAGTWQSYTGTGSEMQLLPGDGKAMKYTITADGKIIDKGEWGCPNDCTTCNLTNSDICFYLDNGKEKVCCTIVRMDNDTLEYFIVGSAEGKKGFVRNR